VYSRHTAPNSTRFETILTAVIGAPTLTYSSGLAAFFALMTNVRPRIVAITGGYHGVHGIIGVHQKLTGLKTVPLEDIAAWDAAGLGKGDLVHVETPINPLGEATSLEYYVKLAHERGALVSVDATFGPPPLQDPFAFGVDIVMHSGTKYIGGHSDMLCGTLSTKDDKVFTELFTERLFLGSVLGSLEGWLGIRSIRTLAIRVERQSANAQHLVDWVWNALKGDNPSEDDLIVRKAVARVQHASVQAREDPSIKTWLSKQMPNGYGPVFALTMQSEAFAKAVPTKLHYFHHATSLGGVESLIEWRKMTDPGVDPRILRVSIGIEGWEDLKSDLLAAFKALI
jgi:cystathionine gamma-synthase